MVSFNCAFEEKSIKKLEFLTEVLRGDQLGPILGPNVHPDFLQTIFLIEDDSGFSDAFFCDVMALDNAAAASIEEGRWGYTGGVHVVLARRCGRSGSYTGNIEMGRSKDIT
ncbi:Hypothetical predicted protein [Octopus vulgaris]|uniref:Uncharacterized protein n=1 Tax=Octopus vulgaris TaxID=6645 RepID=A0AA36AHU6_OCTVU|nr:Hypothetical predicted protein [Octopus vulgaris]